MYMEPHHVKGLFVLSARYNNAPNVYIDFGAVAYAVVAACSWRNDNAWRLIVRFVCALSGRGSDLVAKGG